jgi:electron transport complex protein RnfG
VDVFVLTDRGAPMATVFATVAPHGYNAAIDLLIGVAPIGTVTGVRVVRHRETQGLGDAIDVAKSDWMLQFDSRALTAPAPELWAIAQDDGEFDAISGATVTSRAVVMAVKNTLLYFDAHRDELYTRAAEAAAATDEP